MHETNTEIDPAIEQVIKRLTDHVDARMDDLANDVHGRIDALKIELAANFNPRQDDLGRRMAAVEERVAEATALFDRWATDLRRDTGLTAVLARQAFGQASGQTPETLSPEQGSTPPVEFERAATAGPKDSPQRVDLPAHAAVAYLTPGADPNETWAGFSQAIRDERGMRAGRRSRRAPRH